LSLSVMPVATVAIIPVCAANTCNELPSDISSAPSLSVFRQHLRTFVFHPSYPDLSGVSHFPSYATHAT